MKHYLTALCIILYLLLIILAYPYTVDDAYITFSYAKNALNGSGFTFNEGEPTEGFTSPLHTILLCLSIKDDLIPLTSKAIGIISGIVLLFYLIYITRNPIYIFSVIMLPSFSINSINGLETMLFTLIISVFLFSRYVHYSLNLSLLTIPMLVFIRPEGIIITVFAICADYFFLPNKSRLKKDFIVVLISISLLILFRFVLYREFLPNTYYVKASGLFHLPRIISGIIYLLKFNIKTLFIPLLLFIVFIFRSLLKGHTEKRTYVLIAVISLFFGIIIYEGGDWIPFNRFIIPIVPAFFYFAFCKVPIRKYFAIVYGVFIISQVISGLYEFSYISERAKGYQYAHRYIADYIGDNYSKGVKIALMDIGIIKFYSEATVFDLIGLTNKNVARDSSQLTEYLVQFDPHLLILVSNRSYNDGFYSYFSRDQIVYEEIVKKKDFRFLFERNHFKFIDNNSIIGSIRNAFAFLSSEKKFSGYYLVVFEKAD